MRVLHVIPSISATRGGPSTVLRTIAKALAAKGVIVDVVTTNDDGRGLLPNVSLSSPTSMDGVTYRFFSRDLRFYTVSWALARWMREHCWEYDLVHIHALFSFSSTIAARCALHAGVPYILRPLGTLNRWGLQNRRPLLKKLSLRFVERRLIEGAAAVHCTSEEERLEAMEAVQAAQWMVLPNPVDPPPKERLGQRWLRSHYPEIGDRQIALFLSRLDPKKGLDLLLNAFASLRQHGTDAVLVLSGEGEEKFVAQLKKMVETLGIGDSVVWTGFLAGSQKYAALEDACVFVLPSYSENFGVSVVEAMSQGVPVIVSDQVALHREISQAHAGLVVPCEMAGLRQALFTLLTQAHARDSAARNGRILATQYSPDTVAERMISVYQGLCRGSSKMPERLAC